MEKIVTFQQQYLISNLLRMAEKNRYISILATVSPRQRLLPRPKGSTFGCGVKTRPSAERCLAKKKTGWNS